jgi:hypothetical protein
MGHRHTATLADRIGFASRKPTTGSTAPSAPWPSTPEFRLPLTRDVLFESPSQAAAVMNGHSTNGPDPWTGPDGRSYNQWFRKP